MFKAKHLKEIQELMEKPGIPAPELKLSAQGPDDLRLSVVD